MLERLDRLPAGRWARLRDDVRRCRLRRGAWYPVLSLGEDEVVVVVRHESAIVPQVYLEIVTTRLSQIPGILKTRTHVAFKVYSKHDLEAMFSVGLQEAR